MCECKRAKNKNAQAMDIWIFNTCSATKRFAHFMKFNYYFFCVTRERDFLPGFKFNALIHVPSYFAIFHLLFTFHAHCRHQNQLHVNK